MSKEKESSERLAEGIKRIEIAVKYFEILFNA